MCFVSRPCKFLLACAVIAVAALNAQATSTPFTFTSGTPGSSTYQNVSGSITSGNGTITITLTNLLTNNQVISIAQNISGLYFSASTNSVPVGTAVFSSSLAGFAMTLVNGQPTNVVTNSPTGWIVANNGVGALGVCVICAGTNAPAGPANTVIGGTSSKSYTNANGSLNTKSHNPLIGGTVTFTLNVAGATSNTTFSNIVVQFGTSPITKVPEADSLTMLSLTGLSMVGALVLRRRFRTGAP